MAPFVVQSYNPKLAKTAEYRNSRTGSTLSHFQYVALPDFRRHFGRCRSRANPLNLLSSSFFALRSSLPHLTKATGTKTDPVNNFPSSLRSSVTGLIKFSPSAERSQASGGARLAFHRPLKPGTRRLVRILEIAVRALRRFAAGETALVAIGRVASRDSEYCFEV